jgi:hypothetical protein
VAALAFTGPGPFSLERLFGLLEKLRAELGVEGS